MIALRERRERIRRRRRSKRVQAEIRAIQKRVHPANLNYGDCFAYALAMTTGEPLLFKGDAFAKTDVVDALTER